MKGNARLEEQLGGASAQGAILLQAKSHRLTQQDATF